MSKAHVFQARHNTPHLWPFPFRQRMFIELGPPALQVLKITTWSGCTMPEQLQ